MLSTKSNTIYAQGFGIENNLNKSQNFNGLKITPRKYLNFLREFLF